MNQARPRNLVPVWGFAVVVFLDLLLLHGSVLRAPFLGDDYIFLTEAQKGLAQSLAHAFFEVPNYFRPVSRELYFGLLNPVLGDHPLAFRVVNLLILGGILALVFLIARALGRPRAGLIAAGFLALFHPLRVLLGYVNFDQDLLAAAFSLATVLLVMRNRPRLAGVACLFAVLSKENAVLVPVILTAWGLLRRAPPRSVVRDTAYCWLAAAVAVAAVFLRSHFGGAEVQSEAGPASGMAFHLADGLRLTGLALFGLEQPLDALATAKAEAGIGLLAGAAALSAALAVVAFHSARDAKSRGGGLAVLGIAWLVLGAIPPVLLADRFNAYYVLFPAIGAAWLVGAALARWHVALTAILFAALGVLNVVANGVTTVRWSLDDKTPPGISLFSAERFRREADYVRSLRAALERERPARGTAVYLGQEFGFLQMGTSGNKGPRYWLGDSTLAVRLIYYERTPATSGKFLFLRYNDKKNTFARMSDSLAFAAFHAQDAVEAHDLVGARAYLERALAWIEPGTDSPERGGVESKLATVCYELGDTAAARRYWIASSTTELGRAQALRGLAQLDASAGRFTASLYWLRQAAAESPEDAAVANALRQVEQMAR
jgi:hypothetical protein